MTGNARKRFLETIIMFVIPIVALRMLDDISIDDAVVFPQFVCYLMLFLAIINSIQLFFYLKKIKPLQWSTLFRWSLPVDEDGSLSLTARRVGIALGLMLLYIFTMEWLGFYLAGFLFFLLILLTLDPERPTAAGTGKKAVYALIFMASLYALFSVMLGAVIPSGIAL